MFKELNLTETEMAERVEYCLDKFPYDSTRYALRRVLGDLDSSTDDEKVFGHLSSLELTFRCVVETLSHSDVRRLLVEGTEIRNAAEKVSFDFGANYEDLYLQVEQLMREVRMYNEKRDSALERIEALMTEIKQRPECPKGFGETRFGSMPQAIDLGGPITQILWPYRSRDVLRGLGLTTIGEVVNHFWDFKQFIQDENVTLLEWLVIVQVLRNHELLPTQENEQQFSLQTGLEVFAQNVSLSVRTTNSLVSAYEKYNAAFFSQFCHAGDLGGFVSLFAEGSADGWRTVKNWRNLGSKSYNEFIDKLSQVHIKIEDDICFPTLESSVRALDFGLIDSSLLQRYELETISGLMEACKNTNRFTGLRYINESLYESALCQLKKYGFDI